MNVVVINYGSGNLRSVAKALERASDDVKDSSVVCVTDDADRVRAADRIVLPGVGAFGDCIAGLDSLPGMRSALTDAVIDRGQPFLGICVGMQLMAERSEEHGLHTGLGWIAGNVRPLEPVDNSLKIPHMGWNELVVDATRHPVLENIETGDHAYFVHSYSFNCAHPETTMVTVEFGGIMTAMIGRDNMIGTQFHPEKSQETGLRLLGNFLHWRP